MSELAYQLPYIESLLLEVTQPHKFIIGMIYRPPNSIIEHFITSMNDILTSVAASGVPVYIMGDLNINILNHNETCPKFS